jgi:peptide/nickel transport system permease protein
MFAQFFKIPQKFILSLQRKKVAGQGYPSYSGFPVLKTWRRIAAIPPSIQACLFTALLLTCAAIFAPHIAPYDPNKINLLKRNAPPSFVESGSTVDHLFGTDQLGRDTLSRCIYGLRVSAGIALFGIIIGCLTGTTLGLISGLFGGGVDRAIMMLVDIQLAVPFLLITLMGIAVFGTDIPVLIALVGLAKWETYARLTRGQVLAIREYPFIEAAHAVGASDWRVAVHHILPNITSPLIVLLTLNFPSVLLLESSLSFMGIGVQPPTASLGRMVGEGRDYMISSWWVVIAPAAMIVLVTLVMQLIGDWLRDTLDVQLD